MAVGDGGGIGAEGGEEWAVRADQVGRRTTAAGDGS
jgi:hypothetical protein